MKTVQRIYKQPEGHWVGDGFPVHTVLDYQRHPELSPFLLLDHFGPADFTPADKRRGVDWHPHRGFETVTVLLEGEVEHQDTAGNGGLIGPGEVQWMTAGSGLLHQEFHSDAMTRKGGRFHGFQLWVNLPAKHKMTAPRYQTLTRKDIPQVASPEGTVRVIAGEFRGTKGPAQTFTPVTLLVVELKKGKSVKLDLQDGHSTALYVGRGKVNDAAEGELVLLSREGKDFVLEAESDAIVFVMSGAPLDEPVAGYGPFVMNTPKEIQQAFADYHAGRLGTIPTMEKTL